MGKLPHLKLGSLQRRIRNLLSVNGPFFTLNENTRKGTKRQMNFAF